MSAVTTYFGAVYPAECDHMGHLNVAHYVAKFDAASWNFFFSFGVTREAMDAGGFAVAAVEQKIAYRRELMPGDVIEVRSRILEVKDKAIRFVHEMIHRQSGEVAATSEFVTVCLDRVKRKAKPYPEAVLQKARGLIKARSEQQP
jgi:acyl-CoA thioester hydrolase